jgi:LPXTG-motif cell wall-anchored protein
MRKAARTGRGTYTYIGKPKEVREKMSALFARLESPVLTDIKLHWRQGVLETYPTPVPDLYAGEPLVVVVQARHLGDEVRITGMRAGTSWQQSVSLRNGVTKAGIARLYARRKIDSITLNTGDLRATLGREAARKQVRNQIVEIGLRYHLVSRHTSLVAVERESSVPSGENLKAWPVPVNLPDGWEIEEIWLEKPTPALMKTASYMYEFDKKSVAENARIFSKKKIAEWGKKRRAEEKKAAQKHSAKFTAAGQPGLQAALAARLPQTATPAQLLILLGMALLLAALLLRRWVLARC